MNGPAMQLSYNGMTTRVSYSAITTRDITLNTLVSEYGGQWGSVSTNIIELWNRIERLEAKS